MRFISLEEPGSPRTVSLYIHGLKADINHKAVLGGTSSDSKRISVEEVEKAVRESTKELIRDLGWCRTYPLSSLNQFNVPGIKAWEYRSNDYVLVILHALKVAKKLSATLHLRKDVLFKLLGQRSMTESFDIENADPTMVIHYRDESSDLAMRLEAGEYFVLSNVVLGALPAQR